MSTAPEQGAGRSARWTAEQRAREHTLLDRLADLPADDPERGAIRDELVLMHLPLVRHLARRYRDRGESYDDLVQVGTVGLIKAVDRFDPTRGVELSTYATPTILGEIKRHFRDRTWSVRVPRRLQETHAAVLAATDAMTQDLGRAPTVRELAAALDLSEEDVLEALEVRHAYAATTLDAGPDTDGPSTAIGDLLGMEDDALAAVEDREALRPLLAALPERERRIIMLRFFQNQSQTQIAQALGISQMHVSRLLSRTLGTLRLGLAGA
jgi:RNA polymerase sigma-B factor